MLLAKPTLATTCGSLRTVFVIPVPPRVIETIIATYESTNKVGELSKDRLRQTNPVFLSK